MKILIVVTYYRPHWTGLTQYAARLAEGLAAKGHQVEILCSQHKKSLPLKQKINQVLVYRVPFVCHFLRSVIAPRFPFQFFRRAKKNEIILFFLPLQEILLLAPLAWLLQKKFFLVHNGDLVLPKEGGLPNRLVEQFYFLTTSLAVKLSNGIIIHTRDYAMHSNHLLKHQNKWRVLLPPFHVPKINPDEVKKFVRQHHLQGKVLIGFSGRFVEEKGIDYLLKAVPLVVKEILRAHFVFAGEHRVKYENFWPKLAPLIEKHQAHLSLLGLLDSQKEIFVFYKSLDLLLIPSRTDCFPFAQVEAMLSGVPVVCTNIPGARWPVKTTGMGLLVKPRSPKSLAQGIITALSKKQQLRQNWPQVKKIFSYPKALDEYEKTLST